MIYSTTTSIYHQSEQSNVYRQAYISQTARKFSQADLEAIKKRSTICNWQTGLCGLLLIAGGRVIHILEGEETAVRDMMAKIENDPRHHSMKIFSTHAGQEKSLHEPSLFISDLMEVPENLQDSLGQMMTNFQWSRTNPELETCQIDFLKRLALFSLQS